MPPTTMLAIEDLAVDVIVKAKLYRRVLIALLADHFLVMALPQRFDRHEFSQLFH